MPHGTFDIRRTTRGQAPRIPFERMAREILGKDYVLSLVICGDSLSRRMNRTYRKKEYAPNVLSFPIGKNEGEIFLNIRNAEREAKKFDMKALHRIAHLFVHGCFHLKGYDHGKKMDSFEIKVLKKFGFA